MHTSKLDNWKHNHDFSIDGSRGEQKTKIVIAITVVMMLAEIIGGVVYGSMALLADGWHMGTHVAAFGITIFAYRYAKKHQESSRFSFGAGKVTVLGGFASSIALLVVALVMAIESLMRLIEPHQIYYNNAIIVAVIGLVINGICAVILHGTHDHGHHHNHDHSHDMHDDHKPHHDHNLKAAYMHVLADALTSITAIMGLLMAKYFGWVFMDAFMGIVGCLVITKWAFGLLKESSPLLLDQTNVELSSKITSLLENDSENRIVDLHVWRVSPHHHCAIVSIVTHSPEDPSCYKKRIEHLNGLSHISIEINPCVDDSCIIT